MPRVVMTPAERFQRWRDMARLSVRQNSLLRRAYEFHKNHGAEVFLVLYHHHKFHVYTSSTHPAWPPSLSDIDITSPSPDIYTADTIESALRLPKHPGHPGETAAVSVAPIDANASQNSDQATGCLSKDVPGQIAKEWAHSPASSFEGFSDSDGPAPENIEDLANNSLGVLSHSSNAAGDMPLAGDLGEDVDNLVGELAAGPGQAAGPDTRLGTGSSVEAEPQPRTPSCCRRWTPPPAPKKSRRPVSMTECGIASIYTGFRFILDLEATRPSASRPQQAIHLGPGPDRRRSQRLRHQRSQS